jgi:hypothetical protein
VRTADRGVLIPLRELIVPVVIAGQAFMKKKTNVKQPFTKKPKKKYPFPVPIPPCSVVSVRLVARSPWAREVGRIFRIGYYDQKDGLDCIWLVDERGGYNQTIDHECLEKFFRIESVSKERSLYGRGPMSALVRS